MSDNERVDPARTVWRWFLRQKAAWRAARVARCRAAADATILRTPPVPIDPLSNVEVHSLTCERDYLDLLWCLKSFHHFSDRTINVVIHDDGSLSDAALRCLSAHLPGATVIPKAVADERVNDVIRHRRFLGIFRNSTPLAMKAIDFPIFATKPQFVLLDSDVLFFSNPTAMLRNIDEGTNFFMSDYQDGYTHSREELARRYGISVLPKVNTGVASFSRDFIDCDLVDLYCSDLSKEGLQSHPWSEQTLLALLYSRTTDRVVRLPSQYALSRTSIDGDTASHHFVNDGSRGDFYTLGIRRLRRAGFLRALAEKVA